MASLGHLIVGALIARVSERDEAGPLERWTRRAFYGAVALMPDLDVFGFPLGVRYEDDWGHRGATHSLCFAALSVLLFSLWLRLRPHELGAHARAPGVEALLLALTVATHGPLDMLTDGGLGIALFYPFSTARHFFRWQPLPVAPIGPGLLSRWGASVMGRELLYFSPLLLAVLWPSRRPASRDA